MRPLSRGCGRGRPKVPTDGSSREVLTGSMAPVREAESTWVFGYGSLIWRPAIPYVEQRVCRLTGWRRVFWQGSPDHRGTPEAPGRVVTLVPDEAAVCWGRAFRIAPESVERTLQSLDVREQGGYERHIVDLEVADDASRLDAILWIAAVDNEHHLGPAPLHEVVAQIVASVGPSGANVEYVLRLDEALREIGAADAHVREVADAVRERLGAGEGSLSTLADGLFRVC